MDLALLHAMPTSPAIAKALGSRVLIVDKVSNSALCACVAWLEDLVVLSCALESSWFNPRLETACT